MTIVTAGAPVTARRSAVVAAVAGAVALAVMLVVWHAKPTVFDNYVYLADAWLHGRNWVTFPGDWIDAVPYHGRAYVVEAPFPAIVMLPFTLVQGLDANQTFVSNLAGAVATFGAWRVCVRCGLDRRTTAAAVAFVFFGTSLYVCATVGSVWYVAHAIACACTFLALDETFGRRRPWLVASLALGAAFSRYPLFLALPAYAVLLYRAEPRRAVLESFLVPIVPAAVVAALYNFNRFGVLYDPGYAFFYTVMDPRASGDQSAFRLAALGTQLRTWFLVPPQFVAGPPWIDPPRFGNAVTWTGLPFLYALAARPNFRAIVLAVTCLLTAIPSLVYFDSGAEQYGVRHALDAEPFAFALLATALAGRPNRIVVWALIAFAAFGAYEGTVWILAR